MTKTIDQQRAETVKLINFLFRDPRVSEETRAIVVKQLQEVVKLLESPVKTKKID